MDSTDSEPDTRSYRLASVEGLSMSKLSKLSRNKRTETQKYRLSEQPLRTEKNRKRKLEKHIRGQPNDSQAVTKLGAQS